MGARRPALSLMRRGKWTIGLAFGVVAVLGIGGLSALGSLFGLLAVRGRTRQAALPVLVLPLVSPVIIAATRATQGLTHGNTSGIAGWLGLLAAFDAAFLAVGYIVFGHLLED